MLLVAPFEDLMATKLKVILQRAESKDYRDIAAMLQAGVSLSRPGCGPTVVWFPFSTRRKPEGAGLSSGRRPADATGGGQGRPDRRDE